MTDGKMSGKNNKHLTAFLHSHGHGPQRLRVLLARVDWQAADAFAHAREALSLFVATVAELLLADARSRRLSPGARLNALVTGNDASELPLLGLALQHIEAGKGPLAGLLPRHRNTLDAAVGTLGAHVRLLRDGTLPAHRINALTPLDTETLLPILARQLHGEPATLRLLKLAAQGDDTRGALLRRVRLVQTLLRDAPGYQPLEYPEYRALPAALRSVLLFTPALHRFFLSPQAQAAARPPSPDFDPLYIEHALAELGRGRLAHVDVDTLFLAATSAAFRARIVATLAEGSGDLTCDDDVRERLILGANVPEICLVACAAARSPRQLQQAIAQLPALPGNGVLGEALYGFARIAWRQCAPAEIPTALLAHPGFAASTLSDCCEQLLGFLRGQPVQPAAASLFRNLSAWLALAAPKPLRRGKVTAQDAALNALADAFASHGARLAADIDGHDLHALYVSSNRGGALAIALARALREHNPARWAHGFFTRLAEIDPGTALAIIGNEPRPDEAAILKAVATPYGDSASRHDTNEALP